MTLLALETDETLLIGKIVFLVLLYAFILFVMRSATKGMTQAPQESIILGAAEANALRAEHGLPPTRLLVLASSELGQGRTIEVAGPTVVGRDATSGIRLEHDEFASSRHARIEPRPERSMGRRSRLDERHVRQRHEAEEGAAREGRRRHPDRRDRAAGAGVKIGRGAWSDRHGPQAHAQRGRVRLRAAAVRDRGRHGRRAGRRGRRAARRRRARGRRDPPSSTRPVSRPPSRRRTAASGSARSPIPSTAGMGTTVTVALVDAPAEAVVVRPRRRLARLPAPRRRARADHDRPLARRRARRRAACSRRKRRSGTRSARRSPARVGTESAIEVDVFTVPGELGDLVLLCSDGLYGHAHERTRSPRRILGAERDPDAAADALVAAANATRRRGQHHGRALRARRRRAGAGSCRCRRVASAGRKQGQTQRPWVRRRPRERRATCERTAPGAGGRLTALALIALVVVVGVLVLYWGISR